MKRIFLNAISAGAALAMMSGPLAMAQQDHNDNGSSHSSPIHNAPEHANVSHGTPPHLPVQHVGAAHSPAAHSSIVHATNQRPVQNHSEPMQSHTAPAYHQTSSAHSWHNGDHYNGGRQVADWHRYHVRQPPAGYEWVQNGSQLVLISIAGGIVAEVVANSLYQ